MLIFALSVASANLAAKERQEREAARAAERAAQRAVREAYTKEAIARAVREALAKAGFPPATADAGASAAEAQSRFSGTNEKMVGHGFSRHGAQRTEPFQRREGEIREEEFLAAAGNREAQRSEIKEEPIVIDASQPWDPRQFGGKKPRISCVVPVFTSMRTGKIIDVNEPNPLDPPEHMLRDEFRRKPQSPTPAAMPASAEVAQCDTTKAAEKSRECRTNENSPPFQRREGEITEEEHLAAAGTRGPRPFSDKDGARDFAEEKGGESATKKEPLYSITSLLIEPPRPFESKPRDPCTDPPETPPPPKPKPGPRLHPIIEYWGLH